MLMDMDRLKRARAGSKADMEEIIRSFEPLVKKECGKVHIKDHDFEDLKQVAYIGIIKAVRSITDEKANLASAYIQKSIQNSLNYVTRRTLRKPDLSSIEDKDLDGIPLTEKLVSGDDTENQILRSEDSMYLKDAFETLTPKEKDILGIYMCNDYGGLKRCSDIYHEDYRRIRYQKDKAIRKLRAAIGTKLN
jgi:RNA polymerase sigma factor (sigma-70 family)